MKEGHLPPAFPSGFTLKLEFDEERVAQLLTRDAWSCFSSPTELKDRYPVREVPSMPRKGIFHLPADPTIITYYLNFATSYYPELKELGWPAAMYTAACERLLCKIEETTGLRRRAPVSEIKTAWTAPSYERYDRPVRRDPRP